MQSFLFKLNFSLAIVSKPFKRFYCDHKLAKTKKEEMRIFSTKTRFLQTKIIKYFITALRYRMIVKYEKSFPLQQPSYVILASVYKLLKKSYFGWSLRHPFNCTRGKEKREQMERSKRKRHKRHERVLL